MRSIGRGARSEGSARGLPRRGRGNKAPFCPVRAVKRLHIRVRVPIPEVNRHYVVNRHPVFFKIQESMLGISVAALRAVF